VKALRERTGAGMMESKVQVDAEIVYCSLEQVVQVLDSGGAAVHVSGTAPLSRFMSTMRGFGIAVPVKQRKLQTWKKHVK